MRKNKIQRGYLVTFLGLLLLGSLFWLFPSPTFAAIRTWDGGGSTENWTEDANWSSDLEPGSADIATFDGTSTKNATIDGVISVAGVDINAGYSGIITQGSGATVTVGSSNFDQAAGTFTGDSSAITINGSFTLSAGTFTSTSGVLSVKGSWTHTLGGTFAHNNGTLRGIGSVDATYDFATSETFYNFTLDKTTNWQHTVASGDSMIVTNAIVLNEGRLQGAGTVEVKGTVTFSSTYDHGVVNWKFSGTGDQTLTLYDTNDNINGSVTIDKASGLFTLGSDLLLDCGSTSCYFTLTQGSVNLNGFNFQSNDFTLTNGTFTTGSSTVEIDDDLTLTNGTFNASSGNTKLGGDFTHNSGTGTFSHNNGTFIFDTTQDQTIDVGTSETFYNVTMDKGGYREQILTGDTIIVTGALVLTNGRFGVGTIEAQGSVTISSQYDTDSSTLKFTGSNNQIFDLTGGEALYDGAITIDKTTGSVTLASALTMNATKAFTMTAGTFDLAGFAFSQNSTFSQSGGTFTGGSGTIDIDSTFTLSGGTFTSTSGTLKLGNAFTHTAGGAFTHNNGTVEFDTLIDVTYDVSSSETFYNLTINKGGYIGTISSGDTFVVLNTLSLTNGRFNTGILEARGAVTVGSQYDVGTAVLNFGGSATQTFTLTGAEALFDGDINVNKSGGAVNLASALTMNASNQDLTIQEGTFNLAGYALSVTGGATEKIIVESGGVLQLQGGETITADSSSYPQLDTGSTISYVGTAGPYTLKDYTYKNLTINGSGATFSLGVNETIGGDVTVTAGILDSNDKIVSINGNTLINGGTFKSGTNTITFGDAGADSVTVSSGTLEVESDAPSTDIVRTANAWTNSGGAVSYTAATGITSTILVGLEPYYNLTINSSGSTYSLPEDTVVNGSLTLTTGTLSTSGSNYALTVAGSVAVNGGELTLNGSSVDFNGSVSIDGGTFTATSGSINIAGNISKGSGTFTHNSGTVVLDGTSQQISGNFTFNHFNKTVTSAATLTLPASTTTTVLGTLTLQGASGQVLSIRSSVSDTQASVDPQSTRVTVYLDVKDNNNINASAINCRTGCVNSLNNTNWSIGDPSISVTESGGTTVVTEGGATDTYTVVLGAQPTANVTIALSLGSQVSSSASTLTFTDSNWNSPQTITVTAVNDSVVEGSHTGVITHASSSADSGYDGISISSVTANITDNDTAGITASAISGSVSETGTSATFTLVLTSQPSANVSIGVVSSDTTEGSVSPSSVTFTALNWSSTQTITVTGADDFLDDGDITYELVTSAATSSDVNYSGLNPNNVSVTTLDNDSSGFTTSSLSGNTSEAGTSATFTLALSAQPTADVSLGISSSDTTEGSVSPSSVTFTASNWSSAQTITVTGVNDDVVDGNVAYSIILAAASSADSNYNNLNPGDVSVTNIDGDSAGVTLSQSNGSTTVSEGGVTDTYTLVLTSQPTSDVLIQLSGTAQIQISTSAITFTSGNWNTAQTITVSALRDTTVEGNHSGTVSHSVTSSDTAYHGISIASLVMTVLDNTKPTANAGSDITVSESAATAALSGTSSSDSDGDGLTYAWTESADSGDGCSLSNTTSATPTINILNKESSYDCVYQLSVNDGYITSDADSVTLHVNAVNDAPAIGDLANSVSVDAGSNVVIIVATSDVDSTSLNLSAQDPENDFSVKSVTVSSLFSTSGNSGTFNWSTTNSLAGEYTLGFQVSDGANTVSQIVTITVSATNQPPVLDQNIPNVSFMAGTTTQSVFNLNQYFSDPDGDELTFEVAGNKKVDVNITANGKVIFSADEDFSGTEDMSFTATDPSGLSVESKEINVTVSESEGETSIDYITGSPQGKGIVKVYDKQNNLIARWKAFPVGGVIPKVAEVNGSTYVFTIKRRAGTTIHVYTANGELVNKQRLSPHVHVRRLAIGNLNETKETEEIVLATTRDHNLYFKVFRFTPKTKEITVLYENPIPFSYKNFRVTIQKKKVLVLQNGEGTTLYSWDPF